MAVTQAQRSLDDHYELIDPRGEQTPSRLDLAERHSLAQLKEGKILFYNNTKLDFNNYPEVFKTVKKEFEKRGITNFVDHRETVRGKTTADFRRMAREFASQGFAGAVLGIGDIGVTPGTTVLTIELEKAGIPSVYITAPPGTALAKAVARLRAGRLCMISIDTYQASTEEEVRAEVLGQMDAIVEGLTLSSGQIERRAAIDLSLDEPAATGSMSIPRNSSRIGTGEMAPQLEDLLNVYDELHLSDGLPVVPPTLGRVEAMLEFCPWDREEVLAREIGPSGADIRVIDIAVGAVMAGCKPEYMPILVTAFRAMAHQEYNFLQSVTTSHPGGNLVLVSGPLTQELNIHGGQGCLGPGFRANATIGRAVNLVITARTRSIPGVADLDCMASQAEYSYCFGEKPGMGPWPLMHEERFDKETTSVYVLKAEPPHDVIDFLTHSADELLEILADSATSLGSNNAYITGNMVVVVTVDHARILHKDGWDKDRIRKYLFETVSWPREKVQNRGIKPIRPAGFDEMDPIPVTRSPRDIEIVVAGGRGGHSAVILPWALHSEAVVEPVVLPDGSVPGTVEDFRRSR